MMFRRNKIEMPNLFKIEGHSFHVYRSWREVPFKKYIDLMDNPDKDLEILTGALPIHLEDKQFYRKMDSMTKFRLYDPKQEVTRGIVLDRTYTFPDDLNLLEQTTDQFVYIDNLMKPVKSLAEKLAQEQDKDNPDPEEIIDITQKQSLEIIKIYPNLISAYINIAHDEDFDASNMNRHIELINDADCVTVLSLGAFFLSNTMLLISLERGLMTQQEYQEKVTLMNKKKQAILSFRNFGVSFRILIVWLSGIPLRLMRYLNLR